MAKIKIISELKKALYATAFVALIASCTPKGEQPESVATEFLGAYLSADFEKAALLCTPKLSAELKESINEINSLSDELKKHIIANTSSYSPQILDVEKLGNGDTLIVKYSLVKTTLDSTAIPAAPINSTLSIVKQDDAGWKVAKFNK